MLYVSLWRRLGRISLAMNSCKKIMIIVMVPVSYWEFMATGSIEMGTDTVLLEEATLEILYITL